MIVEEKGIRSQAAVKKRQTERANKEIEIIISI